MHHKEKAKLLIILAEISIERAYLIREEHEMGDDEMVIDSYFHAFPEENKYYLQYIVTYIYNNDSNFFLPCPPEEISEDEYLDLISENNE